MTRKLKNVKGLFGQTIHYENGVRVGESWPGLFEGSQKHYDATDKYVGYSDRGIFAEQVYHDEHGGYIGETHTGLFGQKKHYSAERGFVGETWDGLFGEITDLAEKNVSSDQSDFDDVFDGDDW